MLVLEIEFLLDVAFAARHDDPSRPDFPPQEDRTFAALTATWGVRGERGDERGALEWLESQEPPFLIASGFVERTAHDAFVPTGDDTVPRAIPKSGRVSMLPPFRRRQARQFPAARPHDPIVRMIWQTDPPAAQFEALSLLARDTAYIGHSASLTRCTFRLQDSIDMTSAEPVRFRVYPGRLAELERAFHAGQRLQTRQPHLSTGRERGAAPTRPVFDSEWIVLADEGGSAPDVRAMAIVAKKLRDTLMAGFGRRELVVPAWLSGHMEDGKPLRVPHLAIVPLSDIGWRHSEGRLMGLGLVFPAVDDDERERRFASLAEALWSLNADAEITGAPLLELCWAPNLTWNLRPASAETSRSLQTHRYMGLVPQAKSAPQACREWATVTPIVLDRFPKGDAMQREAEMITTIRRACTYIGLPEPSQVDLFKHSAFRGAVSAYPSGTGPEWTGWTLPESLRGRLLTHATLAFSEGVHGPILLGAGRYVGLGVCLPRESRGMK